MGSMIPKEIKYNLHYGEVRRDVLRPSKSGVTLQGKNLLPHSFQEKHPLRKEANISMSQSRGYLDWACRMLDVNCECGNQQQSCQNVCYQQNSHTSRPQHFLQHFLQECMYVQRKLRSSFASTQSNQNLRRTLCW